MYEFDGSTNAVSGLFRRELRGRDSYRLGDQQGFAMKIWPWTRFAELEARNVELVRLCAAVADATNAVVIDTAGTVVRHTDFDQRSLYVTASARNTLIEGCRFWTKPHDEGDPR